MPSRHEELPLDGVRTVPVEERKSKVRVEEFAPEAAPGMTVSGLVDSLPDIFAGKDFRRLVDSLEEVVRNRREWLVLLGGHVIKTGVVPCLLPFVRRKAVTAVGMNGSAAIHDVEVRLVSPKFIQVFVGSGTVAVTMDWVLVGTGSNLEPKVE